MGRRRHVLATLLTVGTVLVLTPVSARAATVLNGGFESGALSGWQVRRETQAGNWFSYSGTAAPIGHRRATPADPVQPPPRGTFAAVTDQANPDSLILYQDVALEPGLAHRLSLLAYYDSYEPIAIPSPDTLSVADEALRLPNGSLRKNQQFRVDVIRPEAPLDSLDPADILRPVFATRLGGPLSMAPTMLTANLSAFGGQTVRIRISVAATEEVFNAGVDAVSIESSRTGGAAGPRNAGRHPTQFAFGRVEANRRRGTATLKVHVGAPGLLRAAGERRTLEAVTVPAGTARTVTLHLRPTSVGRALLQRRRRLRLDLAVTFMPFGGLAEVGRIPIWLRLAKRSN